MLRTHPLIHPNRPVRVFLNGHAFNPNTEFQASDLASLKRAASIPSKSVADTVNVLPTCASNWQTQSLGFYKFTLRSTPQQRALLAQLIADYQKRKIRGECAYYSFEALERAGILAGNPKFLRIPTYAVTYGALVAAATRVFGRGGIERIEYFGKDKFRTTLSLTTAVETVAIPAIAINLLVHMVKGAYQLSDCLSQLILNVF
jgi:hypothetical protein